MTLRLDFFLSSVPAKQLRSSNTYDFTTRSNWRMAYTSHLDKM